MAQGGNPILTLNAGSTSLKFAVYQRFTGQKQIWGQIAAIGPKAKLLGAGKSTRIEAPNHARALEQVLLHLADMGAGGRPDFAGHRVVHGGSRSKAAKVTAAVLKDIERASVLAPLHNPAALEVIGALRRRFPALVQIACFDSGFHATNPPEATTIAIPERFRDAGIRRYGFHGLSFSSLVRRFPEFTGEALPRRVLALHLGAGASLAGIVDGMGVATTMGFSPMDGLVMATRCGAIDAGVLLHLMRHENMKVGKLDEMLNQQSGLLALSGETDMKALLGAGSPRARFAISHYCYWVCRHAGSMIAAMGGVDGMIFTGGIGENADEIRQRILTGLSWTGVAPDIVGKNTPGEASFSVRAWAIPADEEGEIAFWVRQILG